ELLHIYSNSQRFDKMEFRNPGLRIVPPLAHIEKKMKRLSYNWFHETLSTMLTTIIIVTLSVTIFDYFREYYSDGLLTQILKTNLIVTPIITVFWGLQPVINSGRIPKTLYENGNGELYLNKNFRLDFNEIDKVVV